MSNPLTIDDVKQFSDRFSEIRDEIVATADQRGGGRDAVQRWSLRQSDGIEVHGLLQSNHLGARQYEPVMGALLL